MRERGKQSTLLSENLKSFIGIYSSTLADIWEKSKGPDDFHLHELDKVKKEDVVTAVRLGQVG